MNKISFITTINRQWIRMNKLEVIVRCVKYYHLVNSKANYITSIFENI